MTPYEIIKRPLITEKAVEMSDSPDVKEKTYCFAVDKRANKLQIKQAIRELYQVRVKRVRTAWCRGKTRRYRLKVIRAVDWKKAYVTLAEGESIELI